MVSDCNGTIGRVWMAVVCADRATEWESLTGTLIGSVGKESFKVGQATVGLFWWLKIDTR